MTNDVSEAVNKVRQGHVEFKMDKTAIVHAGIGKVSFVSMICYGDELNIIFLTFGSV